MDVNYNVADLNAAGSTVPVSATQTFEESLATFISVYPAIQSDFITSLAKITPNTEASDTNYAIASNALQAFATLVGNIASEWKNWSELKSNNTLKSGTNSYTISENDETYGSDKAKCLQIVVASINNATLLPTVFIPNSPYSPEIKSGEWTGYFVDSEGDYLLYANRNKYPQRTLKFSGLSLLSEQDGWGGVSIVRNKYLFGESGAETNSAFIYQSPLVRQKNVLTPLLVHTQELNMTELNLPGLTNPDKLSGYLKSLVLGFFGDSNSFDNVILKFQCNFSYTLLSTSNQEIVIPVLLTTPYAYSKPGDSNTNLDQLGTYIDNWMQGNNFTTNTNSDASEGPYHYNGKLNFKIEMFSNSDTNTPIAIIDDLYLPVDSITWTQS